MAENPRNLPLFSEDYDSKPVRENSAASLLATSSISATINAWEENLAHNGRSIHTIKAFGGDLRMLAKYIGSGQAINAIGTHDLKNFLNWMLNHRNVSCSPKTYARRITSIKSFFRWLTDIGILNNDPAAAVPQQTVLAPLPKVLTTDEVESILTVVNRLRQDSSKPDARPYTLVCLLLHTGIKKNECLNIHLNHIDLNSVDGPILYVRYGNVSKRYRERKLIMPPDWITAYSEYCTQYQPQDVLFPYSPRRLEYILEDIGQAANLEKHLSFNMCRWTASLLEYSKGTDKNAIRQKLGISKIQWREIGNKLDRLAEKTGSPGNAPA